METFEPGITCPFTTHSFQVGEKGMKCLSCQRVVQTHALEEKILNGTVLCYCNNPNFVEAVASSSTPITRLGNNRRQTHQLPVTSNNSRSQLNWRDTVSNNTQRPSTNSISNSRSGISGSSSSRSTIPHSSSSNSGFWVVALLVFCSVGTIWGTTPFGKQLANQIQNTISRTFSNSTKKPNVIKAESALKDLYAKETGVPIDSVECPENANLKAGGTFDCQASAEDVNFRIQVKMENDKGKFDSKTRGLLILSKIEDLIKKTVKEKAGLDINVDCGGKLRAAKPGDIFTCQLKDTRNNTRDARVSVKDEQGSINFSINSKQNTSRLNSSQNTTRWNFPQPHCGDDNPSNQQKFYPVFVNTTNQNTLNYVQNNYCNDAFIVYRKLAQRQSIQVASFLTKSTADELVEILNKDPKIGNGEVGVP